MRGLFIGVLALALSALDAGGSGYEIQTADVGAMGTANAGRAAMARDASTIFGNPAGLALLERAMVTTNATVLDLTVRFRDVNSRAAISASGRWKALTR